MKTIARILISSLLCLMCFVSVVAQDDTRFPPLTSDNRGSWVMLQPLSNGAPRQVFWSPNSQQLAVSASGGTWIYDINQPNTPSHHIKEQTLASKIAYSPKGDIYISYTPRDYCPYGHCEDGQATYVYDAHTHELLNNLHMGASDIVFFHDGDYLAVSSTGYGIVIWRTDSFKDNVGTHPSVFKVCQIRTPAEAGSMTFSPDENLVTYSVWRTQNISPGDKSIWFWDTNTCLLHFHVTTFTADDSMSFPPYTAQMTAYSPDGRYAVIPFFSDIARRHYVYLWDVPTVRNVGKLPDDILEEHVWGFTPDSQHLLLYDKDTTQASVWHIESQTVTRTFNADSIRRFDDTRLLISRAGDLYTITETTETLLWDDESPVKNVSLTADEQWLIIQHEDNKTVLLDMTTQTVTHEWAYVVNPEIAPDKSKMVWIEDYTIQVWDFARAEQTPLQNFLNTGSNTAWSDSEETMVTYTKSPADNDDYSNFNQAKVYTAFDVWTLTDAGFVHRWGRDENVHLVEIGDDYLITEDGLFWDVQTGESVAQLSDTCDPSETLCARWRTAKTPQSAQPTIITPIVTRNGDTFTLQNPDNPDDRAEYILPDHILTYLDSQRLQYGQEWQMTPNGDVLLRMDRKVYNLTQDTTMQMGALGDRRCIDDCPYYYIESIWISQNGEILFAQGEGADQQFNNIVDSIISAWDIETGRWLYDVYGTWNDRLVMSQDERFIFRFGTEFYFGMGKTYYNRWASAYDAQTGEGIIGVNTYGRNADMIEISPRRRFVIVHSDNNRLWAIVKSDEG